MTIQHLLYIPTVFLLGFLFGTMTTEKRTSHETAAASGSRQRSTSGKLLLQTFLVFLLVFVITHLFEIPLGSKTVSRLLGGVEIFDKQPAFSSAEVYARVAQFPAYGLLDYKRFTYTIDVLFPAALLLFLFTLARFAAQRVAVPKYVGRALIGLPFAWFASDLAENAIIFTILSLFPAENAFLASSLGFVTVTKFGLLLLSIVVPSLLIIVAKRSPA